VQFCLKANRRPASDNHIRDIRIERIAQRRKYVFTVAILADAEIFEKSSTVVFARSVKALGFKEVRPSEILGLGLQGMEERRWKDI
jgi:hypothetical protein